MLRNISNLGRWPKSAISISMVCIMYTEHVLRVRVDWSTPSALNEKKFGYWNCIH